MKKKTSTTTRFFLCLLCTILAFADPCGVSGKGIPERTPGKLSDKVITGKITDGSTGKELSGASISVKGKQASASSGADGTYSIAVPDDNAVLVFTFVGYASQEISVKGRTTINVSLMTLMADMAQVVVVGYGTQRKKDVTGAVKSLKSDEFNKGIINSPEQLLQGKVAGVNVTSATGEPGGVQSITVRGPGGVRTGSTPLFVVDGIALDNSSTGGGNPLNFLNPQDIESMDVLKDASATAIYGSRGSNGVIMITTKRGRAGFSNLTLSANLGTSSITNALPVFTAEEFRKQVVAVGGTLNDKGANTDWQKEITQKALTQNYNLAMSGGAEKLTYYASFGMQKQEGIIKFNDLNRYTGRFNATQRFLDDRIIIEANLTASATDNTRPPISSVIGDAISNNPTYPAYDADGNPALYQDINNPVLSFKLDKEITKISRTLGNIITTVKLVKGLNYKLNIGVDNSNGARYLESLPNAVPLRDGRLDFYYTNNQNFQVENYLTYNMTNGDHNLSALAGHSYQKVKLQGSNYSINRFTGSTVEPQYNPGLGQEILFPRDKPGGYAQINELQSFFGRVTYQYKNKYLATVNIRTDGSTKFGENNKYGTFPSFSLGWKINEETFMQKSIFSNLKLRAGWGKTGNQEIPPKQSKSLYTTSVSGTTSYPLSNTGAYPGGTTFSRLANPDLQWEVSTQTDIGLDFGLFHGKLNGTIDFFNKVSNNVLLKVFPADPVQPDVTYFINVPDMNITNKGFELELDYKVRSQKGISYGVGGNMTIINNKVTNSPYSVIPSGSASGSGLTSATINGYINNQPIGTFYLKEFIGFDANGQNNFRDVNGDGVINDNDRIAAGTALPNFMYNFFGSIGYKGFDLVANFNGVSGNMVYDNTANGYFYKTKISKGINTTDEAVEFPEESVSNAAPVSTRYLKDGAFLRLNNLSLGYNFNTEGLGINKWVKSLRLSLTGQNLWLITNYDGYDPEVNTDHTIDGVSSWGIDYLSYPKAKSIIFGLNVSF